MNGTRTITSGNLLIPLTASLLPESFYCHCSLSFIIASLIFQVAVGVGLVFNSRYDIKNQDDICKADKINNLITVAILLITIINVFVSAFGVAEIKK